MGIYGVVYFHIRTMGKKMETTISGLESRV